MNTLTVHTPKHKNAKFPEFLKEVIILNTKEEADHFFKDYQYDGYEFINSEVKKNGNYILEVKKTIGIFNKEKQIKVLNFGICRQGGGDGKNTIYEFTKTVKGSGTVL